MQMSWEGEKGKWKVVLELLELMKHTADRKFGSTVDSDQLREFGYCEVRSQCTWEPITEVAALRDGLLSLEDRRSESIGSIKCFGKEDGPLCNLAVNRKTTLLEYMHFIVELQ